MRISLHLVAICFASVSTVALADLRIGSCSAQWYYLEKAHCDSKFVLEMLESEQPLSNCGTAYQNAHKCFEEKIHNECFTTEEEKEAEIIEFLDREFGKQSHFCEEGLLFSMEAAMENVTKEDCKKEDASDYEACERPFTQVFLREFSNSGANATALAKAYSEAKVCQSEVATSCDIPQTDYTYHFFDASEFNPYDIRAVERVNDAVDRMENGEGGPSSHTATVVTIVIVVIIVAIAVGGAFFYLHRRDIARADIRREKQESQKGQTKAQEDTEMQPLSNQSQDPDEISPA